MDAAQMVSKLLSMNGDLINMAIEPLSDEDLLKQPNDQSNPTGWLLWHQSRAEDTLISILSGKPQIWEDKQWPEKFGLEPDPMNGGRGHTLEQVVALKPTKEALQSYAAAVREKSLASLSRITPADLDKEIEIPGQETRTAGDYLAILATDYIHHCGQVCYLRGYLKGWGWLPV
jgi:uncharacterized damage-inducible protein DinB